METQQTIAAWADSTFGRPAQVASIAARANQEMAELLMECNKLNGSPAKIVEEAADVIIVLTRVFEKLGFQMQGCINQKMAINRKRQWDLDENGHGYHRKEAA